MSNEGEIKSYSAVPIEGNKKKYNSYLFAWLVPNSALLFTPLFAMAFVDL
tara:strand:+ start:328 stop:477 length:150 start_codon:yes stop_codon:yes gene_type:complete